MAKKTKSFWSKPEGITGIIFLIGLIFGGGYLLVSLLPAIIGLVQNTLYLSLMLLALSGIVFMALDSKTQAFVGFLYKSIMRKITGWFIQIDPIGILKNYIDDLRSNLSKMTRQINKLKGQMHKLGELIFENKKQIKENLELASKAKGTDNRKIVILKSRKAGRLKESNMKLSDLYSKMEVLYRVLNRMHENSSIMVEDLEDQIMVKEQERKAIMASNSAMKSAMNILRGESDKKLMFDNAMEAVADDVANKLGEMEHFMDMSGSIMDSIDLQNGVFEEEGIKMLEKWEKESFSLILGDEKGELIKQAYREDDVLDLDSEIPKKEVAENRTNQYDSFFE